MWLAKRLRGLVALEGKRYNAICLLNNVADVNVVLQALALRNNLRKVNMPLLSIEGFYSKQGYCYSMYKVILHLADLMQASCRMQHIFYSINLSRSDLLLSRP